MATTGSRRVLGRRGARSVHPDGPEPVSAPAVALASLVGVLLVLVVAVSAAPAVAQPAATTPPAPTAPAAPAASDEPYRGSGPQLTGRTEPSMTQRIADSLIWVWLLGVLVLGTAAWAWTGRRRPGPDGAPGTPN